MCVISCWGQAGANSWLLIPDGGTFLSHHMIYRSRAFLFVMTVASVVCLEEDGQTCAPFGICSRRNDVA